MELFLGNREELGVEIKIVERDSDGVLLGYALLWLGNQYLGSFNEYIYLASYLVGGLYQALKVK